MIRVSEPYFAKSNVELLQSARAVMRQGHVLAAGCLGRSCLELHLRRLATWYGCEPRNGKAGIWLYCERLLDKGIIDKTARREIKQAVRVGNRCAHGEAVHWADVCTMLDSVLGLLSRYWIPNEKMADVFKGCPAGEWPDAANSFDDGGL